MLFTLFRNKLTNKKERQFTRILFILIVVSVCVYLYVLGIWIISHNIMTVTITAAGFIISVLPLVLLLRGNLIASSFSFVLIVLVTITALATAGQGIHDTDIVAYPMVIILAGLTLNRKLFKLCVGITLAAVFWLIFG